MAVVTTSTEIAASPEQVRRVLLDFARMPEWTQGFIRSIEPVKDGAINQGDKLNVKLEGASFSPIVLENSAQQFKWRGSIPGLVYGDHAFRFDAGPKGGNTTTFVHSEEFGGILAFVMKLMPQGANQKEGFEGFNEDLKRRVESEAASGLT